MKHNGSPATNQRSVCGGERRENGTERSLPARAGSTKCSFSRRGGHALRWVVGGVLYGGLELIWRGYTHPSMLLLAAALCVPLDLANERMPWALPLWLQAVLGGLTITAAELAAGLVLNCWLGLGIWDYSALPGNLWGQICPQYTALWCILAGPVIVAFDWLDHWLCAGERPGYRLI